MHGAAPVLLLVRCDDVSSQAVLGAACRPERAERAC
jgi:hypothetical protein